MSDNEDLHNEESQSESDGQTRAGALLDALLDESGSETSAARFSADESYDETYDDVMDADKASSYESTDGSDLLEVLIGADDESHDSRNDPHKYHDAEDVQNNDSAADVVESLLASVLSEQDETSDSSEDSGSDFDPNYEQSHDSSPDFAYEEVLESESAGIPDPGFPPTHTEASADDPDLSIEAIASVDSDGVVSPGATGQLVLPEVRPDGQEEGNTAQIKKPAELPDAAENLSFEGIEEGLKLIEVKPKRIWPLFMTGAILFILLTLGFTYYGLTLQAEERANIAAIEHDGETILDEAIALIQNADSVIVALDKASASTIKEEDIPRLEALIEQKVSVQRSLDDAISKAQQAKDVFISEENKALAQHAMDAAELRKQILNMSSQISAYDIAAMKSTLAIEYVFTMIIDADAEMRQAVEVVNANGADSIGESLEFNKRAAEKLILAEESLLSITTVFPEVNIQPMVDYLAAKKASAELAIASDQAYIDGDYDGYRSITDEFNTKDAEAVALAAAIPEDPRTPVYEAYEAATVQLKADYAEIRSRAADSDAHLREYLGVTTESAFAGETPAE